MKNKKTKITDGKFLKIEKKRKVAVPFLVIGIILTFSILGIIFTCIALESKEFKYTILNSVLFSLGLVGIIFINIFIDEIYYAKVKNDVIKFLENEFKDKFKLKFENYQKNKNDLFPLRKSGLIARHKYNVLHQVKINDEITLYEIQMLRDLKFRGYIAVFKTDSKDKFIIKNHKYYYRGGNNKKYLVNLKKEESLKQFNNKFKLYSENKNFNYESFNKLLNFAESYENIGFSENGGYRYLLFTYKKLDQTRLFIPSPFIAFDEKYLTRIESELNKIIKIIKIKIIKEENVNE